MDRLNADEKVELAIWMLEAQSPLRPHNNPAENSNEYFRWQVVEMLEDHPGGRALHDRMWEEKWEADREAAADKYADWLEDDR